MQWSSLMVLIKLLVGEQKIKQECQRGRLKWSVEASMREGGKDTEEKIMEDNFNLKKKKTEGTKNDFLEEDVCIR